MENAYIISGGVPLTGTVSLSGAKNISLKTIIAALMFEGEVTLLNVPRIADVLEVLGLAESLGVSIEYSGNTLKINAGNMNKDSIDLLHASKVRVSFMFAAPLLHRFNSAHIPNPGGCRLGARSIDRIIEGIQALGVESTYQSKTGYYDMQLREESVSGSYTFSKPSHTGTEVLIMLATIGTKKVTLHNCALEPEIDELISFLNESGAQIVRNGSDIEIEGVQKLVQKSPFEIISDRNEAVTFATLALATKGDITIQKVYFPHLQTFITMLQKVGATVEATGETELRVAYAGGINPVDIVTSPHPGFMTDWQPNWAILMTQADGDSTIHERIYENRFAYVSELKKLGAHIEYIDLPVTNPEEFYQFNYDPKKKYKQAIKVFGNQTLHNGVLEIADLRAGATLVTAALMAQGESVVNGVDVVERGYENLVSKITALGGTMRKV